MFVDAHIVQQQQHHEANIIHKAAAEHHHLMEFGRIWVASSRQTLVSLHTHTGTQTHANIAARIERFLIELFDFLSSITVERGTPTKAENSKKKFHINQ